MVQFEFLHDEIKQLKKIGLYRKLRTIDTAQGPIIEIEGDKKVLFCSNNYLSLADNAEIKTGVKKAVDEFGYGSAASRLVSGTMKPHQQVEDRLAQHFQKESALLFPSGWTANHAVICSLASKGDLLILDKFDHASIIDAAKASGAEFRTYRREKPEKLEKLLAQDGYRRKFIITESIFSMDGDCADLAQLVELKKKYGAYLIVDEAHSAGCLGESGAGLAEKQGVLGEIDVLVATMSKAFAANGGIVAGPAIVKEYLINSARGFIYTTAASPVNCCAIMAALEIIKNEPERRERLNENADCLRKKLTDAGLNTGQSQSYIIPVIIGDEEKTLWVSQKLFDNGFFIPAIRPPTVAPGTARLRISVQADHTKEQIDALCDSLCKIMKES